MKKNLDMNIDNLRIGNLVLVNNSVGIIVRETNNSFYINYINKVKGCNYVPKFECKDICFSIVDPLELGFRLLPCTSSKLAYGNEYGVYLLEELVNIYRFVYKDQTIEKVYGVSLLQNLHYKFVGKELTLKENYEIRRTKIE